MARRRSNTVPWAGIAVGGVAAALALLRLLKASRAIGGTTYVAGSPGTGPATADPAAGRPA